MNQLHLFPDDPQPRDPHVARQERPRLTGQNAAILARLRRGPASNAELAGMALKYTSRISDLRAAGYVIDVQRQPGKGTTWYRLRGSNGKSHD